MEQLSQLPPQQTLQVGSRHQVLRVVRLRGQAWVVGRFDAKDAYSSSNLSALRRRGEILEDGEWYGVPYHPSRRGDLRLKEAAEVLRQWHLPLDGSETALRVWYQRHRSLFDHLPYPWPQRAARAYETLNQQSLQSVHGDLRRHHIIDSGAYHLVHPCNLAAPASFDLAQLVCFFPHRPLGWILTQLDLKGTDAVLLQVLLAWARRLAKGNQNWPSPVYARWSLQLVGAIEFD